MFAPIGVTKGDFHRAILQPYAATTRLTLLTLDHEPVAQVTRRHLSGQVNWMAHDAEVSRTAEVDLLDPSFDLELDSDSPDDGAVYANRLLRVEQIVTSPQLADDVTIPVFTGPLVTYRRDGDVLTVEAQGKEQRARTDHAHLVCGKGMQVVDAIERIMRGTGENRFALPTGVTDRLPKPVTVGRDESQWPWKVALRLARSIGMQLFYNGQGTLVLRDVPNRPVFTFEAPTSLTRREHDWTEVYNRVAVHGKKKIHAVATAPRRHPFSPTRMGANGVPWQHTFSYSDDKIGTKKAAQKVADQELARVLKQRVKVEFNHPPVWHLDPLDPCRVNNDHVDFESASAPLAGGDMTVGYTSNVRRPG